MSFSSDLLSDNGAISDPFLNSQEAGGGDAGFFPFPFSCLCRWRQASIIKIGNQAVYCQSLGRSFHQSGELGLFVVRRVLMT